MNDKVAGRTEQLPIDVMRIMQMIPHRYPFLMVDRVVELKVHEYAVGIKNVSINEPFFQGHFPRQAVMPGVLIVESMAQTAAVLVVETLEGEAAGKLVYFMSVENARFRKPVVPGDALRLEVTLERHVRGIWKFGAQALVADAEVATAEMMCTVRVLQDGGRTAPFSHK